MRYVFDTSAVIYLLEKWKLADELQEFSRSNELCIPERVKEEFLCGEVDPVDAVDLEKIFKVCRVSLDARLLPFFSFDQSDGAIWVISHALRHQDVCCVIDEKFARELCKFLARTKGLKIRLTGTIGILKTMRTAGILTRKDLAGIRNKIKKSKFRYDIELLQELSRSG